MTFAVTCTLYNYWNDPEWFKFYVSEPNKENLTGEGSQYVYKSPADKIHDSIKGIDEEIKKLDPNSIDYLKEKEKLESIRSVYAEQMSLISEYRSTRAKYIPENSDNKRVADNSTTTNASKRRRD